MLSCRKYAAITAYIWSLLVCRVVTLAGTHLRAGATVWLLANTLAKVIALPEMPRKFIRLPGRRRRPARCSSFLN